MKFAEELLSFPHKDFTYFVHISCSGSHMMILFICLYFLLGSTPIVLIVVSFSRLYLKTALL